MYQQLILIGNLGTDPEMRYTSSGVPVTNFRLAVNRRWTNAEGQVQDKTTWFNVNLWRRQAEIASQYLAKGHRVMIIGEVDNARPWTDRDGNLRATIEVTATELKLMENRSAHGSGEHESNAAEAGSADEMSADKAHIPF
jgi:single-strand DNA-binding protein